eukprot:scaffold55779_cov16-Prasinocladus_malaysianus.AAC.1
MEMDGVTADDTSAALQVAGGTNCLAVLSRVTHRHGFCRTLLQLLLELADRAVHSKYVMCARMYIKF